MLEVAGACQRSPAVITWSACLCACSCLSVFVAACMCCWRQTFQPASQTVRDVCQMFVLALSQQIDLFHLDINEHVLFSAFPALPRGNGRRLKPIYAAEAFSLRFLSINLWLWLSVLSPHEHRHTTISAICSLGIGANLRNEPITFPFSFSPSGVCLLNNWSKCLGFFTCVLCAWVWAQLKQPAVKVVFPLGLCGHN